MLYVPPIEAPGLSELFASTPKALTTKFSTQLVPTCRNAAAGVAASSNKLGQPTRRASPSGLPGWSGEQAQR